MTPVLPSKPVIAKEKYESLKRQLEIFERWRNGRTMFRCDEVPLGTEVSNEDRSAMEVYEFIHSPPEKYFLYCSFKREKGQLKDTEATHYGASGTATTWTGEKLGDVQCGRTWRGNMGDTRVSVSVYAINGCVYHGTYFKSAGNYARVKMSAASKKRKSAKLWAGA